MTPLRALAAATLAALSLSAHAVGRMADLTIFDRATGHELPVHWHDGRAYVVGRPGNEYQVMVRSQRGGDLLAVVSVDGVNVTKSIAREVFSTQPSCTFTSADRNSATNYQDLWWNPDESGWGINITHQGPVVFATLFTYRADGQPLWLSSAGTRIADGLYIGSLDQSSGPAFSASPWNPAAVTHSNVGTMTVQFTRGNMGSLTYTYNGQLVVKSIQREVFAVPATECFAAGNE